MRIEQSAGSCARLSLLIFRRQLKTFLIRQSFYR